MTGVLVLINKRTLDRSSEAIDSANATAKIMARSEWGARLVFLDPEPSVEGDEATGYRVTWRVANIGPAPARIFLSTFKLPGRPDMSQGATGNESYLAGTSEVANQSHRERAITMPTQPRWLELGGRIPDEAEFRVYYTDDIGQQELVWPTLQTYPASLFVAPPPAKRRWLGVPRRSE